MQQKRLRSRARIASHRIAWCSANDTESPINVLDLGALSSSSGGSTRSTKSVAKSFQSLQTTSVTVPEGSCW